MSRLLGNVQRAIARWSAQRQQSGVPTRWHREEHRAARAMLIAVIEAVLVRPRGHFSPLRLNEGRTACHLDARALSIRRTVRVEDLFRAMQDIDPVTSRSRGWIELERAPAPRNLAFVFTHRGGGWQRIATFLEHEARALLAAQKPPSADAALRVLFGAAEAAATGIALRERRTNIAPRGENSHELLATAPLRRDSRLHAGPAGCHCAVIVADTTWSGSEGRRWRAVSGPRRGARRAAPRSVRAPSPADELSAARHHGVSEPFGERDCKPIPNRDIPRLSPVSARFAEPPLVDEL